MKVLDQIPHRLGLVSVMVVKKFLFFCKRFGRPALLSQFPDFHENMPFPKSRNDAQGRQSGLPKSLQEPIDSARAARDQGGSALASGAATIHIFTRYKNVNRRGPGGKEKFPKWRVNV